MKYLAPGAIKLFGEHAVVYNRLSLSAAVNFYAEGKATPSDALHLIFPDLKVSKKFSLKEVSKIYEKYKSMGEREKHEAAKDPFMPFLVIYGEALQNSKIQKGMNFELVSEIPISSGFASSAACFNVFAMATANNLKLDLDLDQLTLLALNGDKVVHIRPSGVDTFTSMLGGYVTFRRSEGAKNVKIPTKIKLIAADTGPRNTGEMVAKVAKAREENRWLIEDIFNKIEGTTLKGLRALKEKNFEEFGKAMDEAQDYLKALGVSTPKIDRIVNIARMWYGHAKISGGGGGGIVIIYAKDLEKIKSVLQKDDIPIYEFELGAKGAIAASEFSLSKSKSEKNLKEQGEDREKKEIQKEIQKEKKRGEKPSKKKEEPKSKK